MIRAKAPDMLARIVELTRARQRPPTIARTLTSEGWLSAEGASFSYERRADIYEAFTSIAASLTAINQIRRFC